MKVSPKVLAIIPARGGSKGIKGKNIVDINGKPLIAWTIEAALKSEYISRTVVSSDSDKILSVAKTLGSETLKRPSNLSQDNSLSIDVVLHAIKKISGYDFIILLQPTSPLRDSTDIDLAFSMMFKQNSKSCTSVCVAEKSPYWMYKINKENNQLTNIMGSDNKYLRRQDTPDVYLLNGAIYISEVDLLKKTKKLVSNETIGYIMDSKKSIDIDNVNDLNKFTTLV
tara:strand:- start:12 stop:689 length:678 start_codon:yes stop_codon:yes gene_type:complete